MGQADLKLERQLRRMVPVSAPPDQQADVIELSRQLNRYVDDSERRHCELIGPTGERTLVPQAVFYVLERVVDVLARGDAVTIVPVGKELTTQQAANMLNVSRQYLVRLLDDGRIPHTKIGRHRRIKVEDLLSFKRKRDLQRAARLDELTELTEDVARYDELE